MRMQPCAVVLGRRIPNIRHPPNIENKLAKERPQIIADTVACLEQVKDYYAQPPPVRDYQNCLLVGRPGQPDFCRQFVRKLNSLYEGMYDIKLIEISKRVTEGNRAYAVVNTPGNLIHRIALLYPDTALVPLGQLLPRNLINAPKDWRDVPKIIWSSENTSADMLMFPPPPTAPR
eukprot:GHVO01065717.1.p1 GENE.GHVO01065717.1~~GHVO01065717.1.p1  ORF type:complete len:175 (-),score=24.74 GHVO01065717.1:48-572(-)